MSAERGERNGRNVCHDLFSHQGSMREYLYSPANSRTIIYVVAPTNRMKARPATENNKNAVYPLVVELAPLSAALPVVVVMTAANKALDRVQASKTFVLNVL